MHIIILHHVTMQLIKYTSTGYVNATEEKGHELTRIRGGNHLNLWANGEKPNVKGKTQKDVNYHFCLLCLVI